MKYKLRETKQAFGSIRSLGKQPPVQVGDIVKIVFEMDEPKFDKDGNLIHSERMWVQVTSISGDNLKGDLDNDPLFLDTIKAGDEVVFSIKNVIDIWKD